jgi:hypothetical protein
VLRKAVCLVSLLGCCPQVAPILDWRKNETYRRTSDGISDKQLDRKGDAWLTFTVRQNASGVWKQSLDFSNNTPVILRPSQNFPPSAWIRSYIWSTQLLAPWSSKYFPFSRDTLDRGNLPSNNSTEVEMPNKRVKGIRSSHELENQLQPSINIWDYWLTRVERRGQ